MVEKCIGVIMDKMYINVNSKKDCCGCRNCENICPKSAIKMTEDKEGFLYPKIDENKCVNCGLCKSVCPWINESSKEDKMDAQKCYALINKDSVVQRKSSSGGAFGVFAKEILKSGGYVCASIMDENLIVKHIITNKESDLEQMYGSKYVSSDLKDNFSKIKRLLNKSNKVLFCGVPCQVNALLKYLQKKYENLITIEIICHGVPSQKLFSEYIKYYEKKHNCKVIKYEFRNKRAAYWGTWKSLVTLEKNGKIILKKENADFDKYYHNFLESNCYRESCYSCKYATKERYADITLGDFWGIEHIKPSFIDKNGVSEIIINTNKGNTLFENIKECINFEKISFEEITKYNAQLENPSIRTEQRDIFYDQIGNESYFKHIAVSKSLKTYIKVLIPSSLKFYIKKLRK